MTIKKSKTFLKHTLTVEENTHNGDIGVSVSLDKDRKERTQGEYLVNALNWVVQDPDKLEQLYKDFLVEVNKREKEHLGLDS